MSSSTVQGRQLMSLFCDFMHGDLQHNDATCRTAARSLLDDHGALISKVMASATTTSSGDQNDDNNMSSVFLLNQQLLHAIAVYGMRHQLLLAPELLQMSSATRKEVLEILKRLDTLVASSSAASSSQDAVNDNTSMAVIDPSLKRLREAFDQIPHKGKSTSASLSNSSGAIANFLNELGDVAYELLCMYGDGYQHQKQNTSSTAVTTSFFANANGNNSLLWDPTAARGFHPVKNKSSDGLGSKRKRPKGDVGEGPDHHADAMMDLQRSNTDYGFDNEVTPVRVVAPSSSSAAVVVVAADPSKKPSQGKKGKVAPAAAAPRSDTIDDQFADFMMGGKAPSASKFKPASSSTDQNDSNNNTDAIHAAAAVGGGSQQLNVTAGIDDLLGIKPITTAATKKKGKPSKVEDILAAETPKPHSSKQQQQQRRIVFAGAEEDTIDYLKEAAAMTPVDESLNTTENILAGNSAIASRKKIDPKNTKKIGGGVGAVHYAGNDEEEHDVQHNNNNSSIHDASAISANDNDQLPSLDTSGVMTSGNANRGHQQKKHLVDENDELFDFEAVPNRKSGRVDDTTEHQQHQPQATTGGLFSSQLLGAPTNQSTATSSRSVTTRRTVKRQYFIEPTTNTFRRVELKAVYAPPMIVKDE